MMQRKSFLHDYVRSVFSAWYLVVIVILPAIGSVVALVVTAGQSAFLWVSIGLVGLVCAQVIAAHRVWLRQYGDVRGLIDDCLRAAHELEQALVGEEQVARPGLKVVRWVLDADRVLQEKAPAYEGELTLSLAKDKCLLRRAIEAATNNSNGLTQQDATSLLRPPVYQLRAIRKDLGNH